MRHHIQEYGHTSVLFLRDDLTFHDIQDLGAIMYRSVQETNGALIVDMRGVPTMDITITGQFVAAHREAKSHRREFVVANASPSVLNTLIAGQVTNLVQIYPTTEEAIADIEERARGGVQRKFIPDVKCGHDDCVYFTYARYRDEITKACQYPFPEEVSNDPSCRCFRMNWNQRKNDAQNVHVPLQMGKKKSLYEIRDKAAKEKEDLEEPGSHRQEPVPAAQQMLASARPGTNNHPATTLPAVPAVPSAETLVPQDPFEDDNFPSAQANGSGWAPQAEVVGSSVSGAVETPPPEVLDKRSVAVTTPARARKPQPEAKNLTPEDTVRHYVESWNEGRFAAEYKTLAKKSRVLPLEEYCQRRRSIQAAQIQTQGKLTRQEIGKFDSVAINGDHAQVEITRVDRTPTGAHCYAESFILIREDEEWRIKTLCQGEERRNPVTPPKGRVMRADDFSGRDQALKRHRPPASSQS